MGRYTFRDTTGSLSQYTHFGFMFLLKSSLVAPIFCEEKLFFVVVVFEKESEIRWKKDRKKGLGAKKR